MKSYIPIYIFALFLSGSFVSGYTPAILAVLYVLIGLITFLLYWKDKAAAVSGKWRVKESTLHFFGLLFGWVGAIVAQQLLRHKTQKKSFRFTFWLTVVLNVVFVGWLHTASGGELLRSYVYKFEYFIANIDSLNHIMPWLLEFTKFQNWF